MDICAQNNKSELNWYYLCHIREDNQNEPIELSFIHVKYKNKII